VSLDVTRLSLDFLGTITHKRHYFLGNILALLSKNNSLSYLSVKSFETKLKCSLKSSDAHAYLGTKTSSDKIPKSSDTLVIGSSSYGLTLSEVRRWNR
jgi:hypothetical protein